MKIVYILDSLAIVGGVERIITGKMNWLADVAGYDVTLITASQGQHAYPYRLSERVRHIDIDARFHLQYRYRQPMRLYVRWQTGRRFRSKLAEQIRLIDPDIIISTVHYKADVACGLKCRAVKIVESHTARSFTGSNDGVRRGRIMQWLHDLEHARYLRRIERGADMVVALTEGDAEEWSAARRVCVIPNMCMEQPAASGRPREKRVIGVGRLIYQKGFDMLVEAWRAVNAFHPDWRLDIFGSGPDAGSLRRQISGCGLDGSITIHEPTAEIAAEYARSSLMVLSSRYEGFGLVLIEAMLQGTPCVSFACPYGPSDIIRDREDGLLVENGNAGKLAEALCYMIEHGDERAEYGRRAMANARRYAPEAVMPQWTRLFSGLTGTAGTVSCV